MLCLLPGGELFQHIAAKGHYRERDAAALLRTLLQVGGRVRGGWNSATSSVQ